LGTFVGFIGLVALIVGGIVLAKGELPVLSLYSRKEGGIVLFVGLVLLTMSGSMAEPDTQEAADNGPSPEATLSPFSPPAVQEFVTEVEEGSPSPPAPPAPPPPPPAPVPQPRPPAPAPRSPTPAPVAEPPPAPQPAPPPAPPAVQDGVTPGAFCSPGGARGVTVSGVPMVCTTTATDDRNRWRAA
jgi:outer membrane biosynthesis protein TonB